jgi:hypothetical protein
MNLKLETPKPAALAKLSIHPRRSYTAGADVCSTPLSVKVDNGQEEYEIMELPDSRTIQSGRYSGLGEYLDYQGNGHFGRARTS